MLLLKCYTSYISGLLEHKITRLLAHRELRTNKIPCTCLSFYFKLKVVAQLYTPETSFLI